jgi:Cu+-exporting ATPase
MALLTGESEAAQVAPGDQVVAGGVVMTGRVQVAVQAIGSETTLSRMASGLEKATQSPPRESAEERWVPWFVAGTIGTALLTALGWTLMHGFASALEPTIAVLVVACPCALALSRPLATAVGLGASARRGMLFRSGEALQALADIDRVAMDKTGTLTRGCLEVVFASDPVLRVAAGIERGSIHPIARAIVEEAQARGIPIPEGRRIQEVPGHGIRGWVDGVCWEIQRSARRGRVEVVGLGEIGLRDRIRSDARHTVEALRRLGLEPLLLTGDQHSVTQLIAKEAGITQAIPALSPQDKAAWIQRRQTASERILYLGDGLNDGLALATANVGIAMGSGAASSVLAADAVIAREGLGPVIAAIRAARATRDAIRVSVRRSLAFNILAVSAAAAGLVNPLVAAILMPLSSGLVLLEALRIEHVVDMHERSR